MKKQNYQLRIVITQGKEVLAEVKMRRDTLEDLPNVCLLYTSDAADE